MLRLSPNQQQVGTTRGAAPNKVMAAASGYQPDLRGALRGVIHAKSPDAWYNVCMMTKRMQDVGAAPTFQAEQLLWAQGMRWVAGVDEAGRGALAGPVVAAAVIVAPEHADAPVWRLVRDSKLLTAAQRQALAPAIEQNARAWGVGMVDAGEIDRVGIAVATRLAMQQAIAALAPAPDHLLIDWVRLPQVAIPQSAQAKADRTMASVAAASILAKVHRDQLMVAYDGCYPVYGFGAHKGYGVTAHLAAIEQHGPCAIHRHTFAPLARQPLLLESA
jgi:ribonuclease HII